MRILTDETDTGEMRAMREGGLEEVTITAAGEHQSVVRVGRMHLMDIITAGDRPVIVYKEKRGDTVKFSADELITAIQRLVS